MSPFRAFILFALLLVSPATLAGERLDSLRTVIVERISAVDRLGVENPIAEKKIGAAGAALAEGLELFDVGDEKSVKIAFKRFGKGMLLLRKAAKRERSPDTDEFVRETDDAIWTACNGVFFTGDVSEPPTEEEGRLQEMLGKKLRGAVKAAGKQRFGQAVKKLAKAYPALLLLRADP